MHDVSTALSGDLDLCLEEQLVEIELPVKPVTAFDPKFAFEVALKYEPLKDVMERFGVSQDEMHQLMRFRPFLYAVKEFQRQIAEKGITFKMKAKVLAEDLLPDAYHLAKNPDAPFSVRHDAMKSVVRWAELDSPPDARNGVGQFNIQINLGDGQ